MIVLIQFAGSIKSDIREIGVRFGELLGYKLGYRPDNLAGEPTLTSSLHFPSSLRHQQWLKPRSQNAVVSFSVMPFLIPPLNFFFRVGVNRSRFAYYSAGWAAGKKKTRPDGRGGQRAGCRPQYFLNSGLFLAQLSHLIEAHFSSHLHLTIIRRTSRISRQPKIEFI